MPFKRKDLAFVITQIFLFLIYLLEADFWSFNFSGSLKYLFLLLAFVGVIIMIVSILQLKTNLSIFPSPKAGSSLITNGIFKFVRHPIYSGIILAALSFALYNGSAYKLMVSGFLLTLFYYKSSYEEEMLHENFPEYHQYKKEVGRFFPKIL